MMGLEIIVEAFEGLGVNMDLLVNLNKASDMVVKNLLLNVLEENESGSKSEYEKILEDINHLVCVEDSTIRIEENVHYKVMNSSNTIGFDFKTIYDKLNKYYKLYKSENDKLLDYKV